MEYTDRLADECHGYDLDGNPLLPPAPTHPLLQQLEAALRDGSILQADVLHVLHRGGTAPMFGDAISEARGETNDDLEIDDYPLVSEGETGTWVSAWIWVPAPACRECGELMHFDDIHT